MCGKKVMHISSVSCDRQSGKCINLRQALVCWPCRNAHTLLFEHALWPLLLLPTETDTV